MPLPAALLARLKRRGILQEGEEEEVIAESYDDDSKTTSTIRKQASNAAGAPGCPNKWNPFHSCVEFCYDYWREGTPENRLPVEYNRRRLRMLKKYPLPNGWKEVYDPGVARHYYWSTETDEVSWLSPVHPKAIIGEAAPKLGRTVFEKIEYQKEIALAKIAQQEAAFLAGKRRRKPKSPSPSPSPEPQASDSDSSDGGGKGKDAEEIELSNFDKLKRAKRRGIDPMDPAAYGDCTTGKWSSGLDGRGEAKTGVDSTASGPLFQSRPYPAPGAILRKNAEMKK